MLPIFQTPNLKKPVKNYFRELGLDWRALSGATAHASGISYRLANGKAGDITDPVALRTFYNRIFYGQKTDQEKIITKRKGRPA